MLPLRAWVANVEDTHYIMGSALGPHPFPEIVRDFQSVIGREAKRQFAEQNDGGATRCRPSLCREADRTLLASLSFCRGYNCCYVRGEAAGLG